MAERVVLHVGLMKSGTSFLQQVLRHNKDLLREQGRAVPEPVEAAGAGGQGRHKRQRSTGAWHGMAGP